MSFALSQPDNKALTDKQKWWHKQRRDWELLHHHPPFMASGAAKLDFLDKPTASEPLVGLSPSAQQHFNHTARKGFRKRWSMTQTFLSLSLINKWTCEFSSHRCACIVPACFWHIYSWHRDSLQAACNGKVLQCQKSHCKLFITTSGLGHSKSKTVRDKAVSACAGPPLCLSLDCQTLLSCPGVGVRLKISLTAFKLQLRTISVTGQNQTSKTSNQVYYRPQSYCIP